MIALEDVYPWLNKFGTCHIQPSSDRLISQMRTALKEGHPNEARGLLQQLKDFAGKLWDDEEVTEILIECAHSAYMLDSLAEAETILVDAVSRVWSELHRRAVIQWMLGCVQWRSLPTRPQAVISWRNSLSDFGRLVRQPGLSFEQHTWYQETCGQLEQSLLEALEQVGSYMDIGKDHSSGTTERGFPAQSEEASATPLPSEYAATHTSATPLPSGSTVTHTSATPLPSESAVTHTSDILQLFTISEEIPAGDFGPSGIDPFPIGMVELDRLSINGHPYRIHSTRGRRIINLPLDQGLTVVKVKGDSMNLENITEKDFVLLRRVDVPANGDIVMAEIVGIDSTATLKRYFKEKDTITLQPNSSNPVHKPFVYKKVEGFYIRGVVIAVLKPI
jgi:phage repressor protein C with HTH and peptisase S24 domain